MSKNRTALITGASAGIGTAFAHEFARHGYDVVLVARRADRLNALAEEIRARHKVEAHVLPADLADVDAAARIETSIQEMGLHVDALVNNAGYALDGSFLDPSWEDHVAMHQVMITSYLELCYRLLPGMVDKKFGRIINVSSLATFAPPTARSMYSAIKRYINDMSIAIDFEFRPEGIHCCALCPGFTYSEFHEVMGVKQQADNNVPKILWQSAEAVAREGYDAVMAGKLVYITGRINRLLARLVGLIPRALQYRQARNSELFAD